MRSSRRPRGERRSKPGSGRVIDDPARPDWYRAALFNELYFLVDGGTFWEAGEVGAPAPDRADPGRFALLECLDYPFYDTVDVDFYASFAVLELYPELELRGILDLLATIPVDDPRVVEIEATGRSAARKVGGTVPHDVGGPGDDPFHLPNWYKFQDVSGWKDLGPKFVLQAWRDAVAAGDEGDALIRAVFPTVDAVLRRLALSDRDGDGLPEHDGEPDQTYDTWPMHGPSAYGGSLWLAATLAAEAMALRLGDHEAATRWAGWFERAQVAFDRRLWRGDHYAYDDGGGPSSESVMADQLAGQWYADATGLGDLVPPERVDAALRTIHARNVRGFGGGRMGAVNGTRPDGTVDASSEQSAEVWVGTTYALAAFMIGRGLVEEGWDTARGAAEVTYERGLWFRTPEAYDAHGDFRASIYLRPLAIWAIEEALRRARGADPSTGIRVGDNPSDRHSAGTEGESMIQRLIGVSLGALVTFLILWLGIGDQSDPVPFYATAAIVGAIASFFWPIVAGFLLARRVKQRREDQIQEEVERQMAAKQ